MSAKKLKVAAEQAHKLIVRAERHYAGRISGKRDGFLWEHSQHVATLAQRLAREEGKEEGLAYLAGLFHDAGKFVGGRYHADDRPEEKAATAAARRIMRRAGFSAASIGRVAIALKSLYQSGARPDALADIVHDADFLSKFGRLGVAQFFIKSALRGRNLERSITEYLSKELTYAAVLPQNMRTRSGRRLARRKAAETLRYFKGLLNELRGLGEASYRLRLFKVVKPEHSGRPLPVRLVLPASCGKCGGRLRPQFSTEKSAKCEQLEAVVRCSGCGQSYRLSFCLPEIPARSAPLRHR